MHPVDSSEFSVLKAVVEGTAQATGGDFMRSLVRNLCRATGVANGFVAEFAEAKTRVRSLAFWMDGDFLDRQEWDLPGTPCEKVLRGNFCHYPSGVSQLFPHEQGVDSYLGVPLSDAPVR